MGLYSAGLIIGRIFAIEIWGGGIIFGRAYFFGRAYYRNFKYGMYITACGSWSGRVLSPTTCHYDLIFQPKTNFLEHRSCLRFIHLLPFAKLGFCCTFTS